jgi:hypothetical protein
LERSDNPGITALSGINNAESVGKLANAFGVDENLLKKRELTNLLHRDTENITRTEIW